MLRLRLLAGVAAGVLLAGTASAGSLGGPSAPTLDVYLNSWHGTDSGTPAGGTTFDYDGVQNTANWSLSWDLNLDPDPFLNGAFAVTNNTGSTQAYILTVILPIAPAIPGGTLVGGSIGGSVTDANFNGVATLTAGTALFDGIIDGTTVLSITPAGGPWSAPFAGGTTSIPATNVGLPGPTIPAIAAANNIAIRLQFSLTAGDTASFTSFFVVEPIPEPATALLFALGLGGLTFAGRRRS
jgi:hypothetical protein